jgi:predicted DNA-binding protein with PD1-like motif
MRRKRVWALVTLALGLSLGSIVYHRVEARVERRPNAQEGGQAALSSPMTVYALRLKPGQDLKRELDAFVKTHRLQAVCVLTCVGSLTDTAIRYANRKETTKMQGYFEIVSLVGTMEPGGGHLHLSVSDGQGHTIGGHLMEGNRVYTTAEIVLGELTGARFVRERDPTYGYNELIVLPRAR